MARNKSSLAADGYWLEYYSGKTLPIVIFIKSGKAEYIRFDLKTTPKWAALLWTCAPTKKMVLNPPHAAEFGQRFEYYPTYADLISYRPELIPLGLSSKSNLDI